MTNYYAEILTSLAKNKVNFINALVFSFIDNLNPMKQVDVFLTEDHSFKNLNKFTENVLIEDTEIKILSKEKLIELKQRINPPRSKDIHDVAELKARL